MKHVGLSFGLRPCVLLLILLPLTVTTAQTTQSVATQPSSGPGQTARPTEWWKGWFKAEGQEAKQVGPPRPQHPEPPFPYTQRAVTVHNAADEVRLAGTLTVPPGPAPHPALLLLSGSGAQDRDETIFAHKPFWVLADHLTRHGIAVLRLDDRGVGGSTGDPNLATADHMVADALAALEFLRAQPEIDARRVGLLGHSEGGLIAALTATRTADVALHVLLATPGLPGHEVLAGQKRAHLEALGVPPPEIDCRLAAHARLLDPVVGAADLDAVRAAALDLVRLESEPVVRAGLMSEEKLAAQAALVADQMLLPQMRWYLRFDPRPTLERLNCPVLALFGTLDLQVLSQDNLPVLRVALRAAHDALVTPGLRPKLRHGLLHRHPMTAELVERGDHDDAIHDGHPQQQRPAGHHRQRPNQNLR